MPRIEYDKLDIFIKDVGYPLVKFLSSRAKKHAHSKGFPNTLLQIGDIFCGKPVWTPEREGLYQCETDKATANKVMKMAEEFGLIIESEFH